MYTITIYALSHIIEGIVAYFFFNNLFTAKKKEIHIKIAFTLTYVLLFLLMLINYVHLNPLFYILFNFILVCNVFSASKSKLFFYTFFLTIIMAATEIITTIIPHDYIYNTTTPQQSTTDLLCFISSKTIFAIIIICYISKTNKDKGSHLYKIPVYLLLIFIISLTMLILLYAIAMTNVLNSFSEHLIAIICSAVIILNFIIIWLQEFIQKKQEKISQMELSIQQENNAMQYFETLHEQDENQKILIHDIKNHILVIQSYCEKGEISEAQHYIDQLMSLPALSRKLVLTKSTNLNIILNMYVQRCEDKGIQFNVDSDGYVDFLEPSHLTSLFCNLLDNAITAAEVCKDAIISLILRYDRESKIAKITLTNSCIVAPKIDKNDRYLSAKRNYEKHGFGMSSIERVIDIYNGNIHTYYDEQTATFHSIILLTNKGV